MSITDLATHPAHYITPAEFSEYLQVSRKTIYDWIDKGALSAIKVGALIRIPLVEAQRFEKVPARVFTDNPCPRQSAPSAPSVRSTPPLAPRPA